MKINRFGTVTFVEGQGPLIENWLVEREPDDPKDATDNQLLLAFAIHWAEQKFIAAKNDAAMRTILAAIKKSAAPPQTFGGGPPATGSAEN